MCGIAGIAYADAETRPRADVLSRMCTALTHRGPDDAGGLVEPGIGLAMRRLSVIDVEGGGQPIFNEDRTIAVVFNGEIYNYPELRDQLTASGHRFSTDSDTETIVHLYEQYGLDFATHLHGMFAVALWDFRRQKLILTRDRLGVKPLYFFRDDERICFGSEIKALLQDASIPRDVDFAAIHQLLTLGHVLPPRTAFDGIQELAPATTISFCRGEIETRTYWDLEYSAPPSFDESGTKQELLEQIKQAVSRRLISEVPLGAFLSGGIDSGIVVALMSQILEQPVKTFSIGFEDKAFSELPYAQVVAKHCHTEHHEMVVQPNVPQIMDKLIAHHDAPFYDTSAIPMYYLSEFAHEHVTVALSGDGGDEMFAGYNIYLANKAARQYQRVPRLVGKLLLEPLARLIPESGKYINQGRVAREFVAGAQLEPLSRYTRWATKIKRETRDKLYADKRLRQAQQSRDELALAPYYDAKPDCSELNRLLYVGTKTELPADMLRKVDRMSMAHSLEVRSPFLDHTLFEYAATLHPDAKLKGWTSKYLLRQIARQLLPKEVVDRPKRGFSIPLDRWLREDLQDYVKQILFDDQTERRGYFDNVVVRTLAGEHFRGAVSRGRELWTLMAIEMWHRRYIDEFAYPINNPEPLKLVSPAEQGTSRS